MSSPNGEAAALAKAARMYAEMGLHVVPVKPRSKLPMLEDWPSRASNRTSVIDRMWKVNPDSNVGLLCGEVLVTVDADKRNDGDKTLLSLEALHGPLWELGCWEADTPNGRHFVFRRPPDVLLPGKLGPGIDLLHGRRQFLVEPSVRAEGAYRWTNGASPRDIDLRRLPLLPRWMWTEVVPIERAIRSVDPLAAGYTEEPESDEKVALVRAALEAVHPSCSRHDYFAILCALDSTGWKDVHERYSRPWACGDMHGVAENKYNERTFNRDVESLSNSRPGKLATLGSLFTIAERHGWRYPRRAETKPESTEGVELVLASTIEPTAINWLWQDWLALGKLAILAGQPGTGKTTIAIACAAIVSKGGEWPDGFKATAGNVLIWSGEDDSKDTLVPRLIAAGADLSRVHFVAQSSDGFDTRPFDPSKDVPALQSRVAALGDVSLIIVDPIVSAVAGDSHKNAEVRRGLAPLVALAETQGAALLGISHFTKGTGGRDPLERVTGSVAFGAVARIVWVAARTELEDGSTAHVLARAKSNIGPDEGGFRYEFQQVDLAQHPGIKASRVEWGTPLTGRARDLLAEPEQPTRGAKTEDAEGWLEGVLKDGPVPVKQLQELAAVAGHAWRTVERAKPWIGVISRRSGPGGRTPFEWLLSDRRDEDL
jgi:putative DNA primase/helicase